MAFDTKKSCRGYGPVASDRSMVVASLEEPWSSLLALATARLSVGDYDVARGAFCELGELRPDLCEAWAGAAVAAHLQGDRPAARTFRNMLEASCPPPALLGWVHAMVGLDTR